MKIILHIACAFAGVIAFHEPAAATTITFETGAPCAFDQTAPLTTAYGAQGVIFSGVGGLPGSILNQCGSFGIGARSGTDFLAFNDGADTADELISFSNPVNNFSIYLGSGSNSTFSLTYFDAAQAVIGSASISGLGGAYSIGSFAGTLSSVRIGSTASAFVLDDLSFDEAAAAVPEPATWAMMVCGLGFVGGTMRATRRSRTTVRHAIT